LAFANEHLFRLGFNNARSSAAARYINLTVASEGQTRRKLAEKAELAFANEHFSAGLQQRQIERSSSEQVRRYAGASPR
tara:strand:- start:13510 stop:13746 length:237 start_codon:yes stop_codon:yes gene_type:complete